MHSIQHCNIIEFAPAIHRLQRKYMVRRKAISKHVHVYVTCILRGQTLEFRPRLNGLAIVVQYSVAINQLTSLVPRLLQRRRVHCPLPPP